MTGETVTAESIDLPAVDSAARSRTRVELRNAALRRLGGARLLADEHGALGLALPLYREALLCLLNARSHGVAASEAWNEAWVRFDATAGKDASVVRAARDVLEEGSPVEADRWDANENARRQSLIENAISWLVRETERLDPEAVAARDRRRRTIAAVTIVAGLLVIGGLVVRAAITLPNVARGMPASASSRWPGSPPPSGVVNGIFEPRFGVHTQRERSATVGIDLQRSHRVERIEVYGRGDNWFDRAAPLWLESSIDGSTYTAIARRSEPFYVDRPWIVDCTMRPMRFVRLRTDGIGVVALTEIMVRAKRE